MRHQRLDVSQARKQALEALSKLSQKWQPVVLAVLAERGETGFNELLTAIPDISGKVLSDTLDELGESGLVERTVISESPLRVEYALTESGADLDPVFEALAAWGDAHLDSTVPRILIAEKDRRMTAMYSSWLTEYKIDRAHDSEQVDEKLQNDIDIIIYSRRVPGVDSIKVPSVAPAACRTILLVDEKPGFELLDIDCDEILFKPIVRETVLEAVESQLACRGESKKERTHRALRAKRDALERVYDLDRLESEDQYNELCSQIHSIKSELEQ